MSERQESRANRTAARMRQGLATGAPKSGRDAELLAGHVRRRLQCIEQLLRLDVTRIGGRQMAPWVGAGRVS